MEKKEDMIMRNAFVLEIVEFMEQQFLKAEHTGEQALCCDIMETIAGSLGASVPEES